MSMRESKTGGVKVTAAAVLLLAAVVAGGCGGEKDEDGSSATSERPVYRVPAALDRDLNPTELDSLRMMKGTHGITRDEYWDDHGGVLANEFVEVWYPDGKVNVLQGAAMFKHAMAARKRVTELFGAAPDGRAVIICSGNVEVYVWNTGREWWTYSTIKGDTINVQAPIDLHTRGLLPVVGPREYYEWAIVKLSRGRAPRWLQEGFASYLAGEAVILEDLRTDFEQLGKLAITPEETERALAREKERRETRRALYNAYRMTEELVKRHGEASVAAWVMAMTETSTLDLASRKAFGLPYADLLQESSAWSSTEVSP